MSITRAIIEISNMYEIDPSLLVETAQDEPSIKEAILKYSKNEIADSDLNYIINQVF
jgi:hypothetical protein